MGFFNFYVLFNIHNKQFAIAAKSIVTIVKEGEIASARETNLMYGKIKANEKSIPIVNLSKELNFPYTIPLKKAVILVIEDENQIKAGIVVDSIEELSLIEDESVRQPNTVDRLVSGQTEINKKTIHILDPNKIVTLLQ